mmetsp:Transcript_16111/g.33340  ORF Transcript_16111/g.33340 Transcript_16111/m.33340 type:complete len:360 (-) Transcript_16111:292-1371(-)
MKFSVFAILSVVALSGVSAFAPPKVSAPRPSFLSAEKTQNGKANWGNAIASAMVGLTFAAQVSMATMETPNTAQVSDGSFFAAQSTSTVVGVETMDFSLPSYGDALGGTVKSTEKAAPPSFNPFGDFMDAPVKKVEEAPKAPEIAQPPIKAPKAEKPAEVVVESPKVEMPKFEAPKVDMPKFEAPKMDMPKFEAPKMDLPKFDAPKMDMPKFDAPKMDMPDMPKFSAPKMPAFEMPKVDAPKVNMPKYDLDIPKVDVPKVDMPALPNVNIPNPFASTGGSNKENIILESRDTRDNKARATRKDFLDADGDVKEAEKVLQALKEVRKAKQEIASEAKDLACADRPGGKYICLRNPFSAGF